MRNWIILYLYLEIIVFEKTFRFILSHLLFIQYLAVIIWPDETFLSCMVNLHIPTDWIWWLILTWLKNYWRWTIKNIFVIFYLIRAYHFIVQISIHHYWWIPCTHALLIYVVPTIHVQTFLSNRFQNLHIFWRNYWRRRASIVSLMVLLNLSKR